MIWVISAAMFLFALWFFRQSPIRRQFGIACTIFAIIGLVGTKWGGIPEWHLFWYTPTALLLAYLFALRYLFALAQRVDEIEPNPDPEVLRSQVQEAVDEYNAKVDEEQRLK